jgi:hypothetical protein
VEKIKIGNQIHMLVFCKLTATPIEGPNSGKPFVFLTRTGFSQSGDSDAVRLEGPTGETLGTGPGGTEPEWEADLEFEEARNFAKHLAPPLGAGSAFVHFTLTATYQPPNRAKITDVSQGCLLLAQPSEPAAGEASRVTISGPAVKFLPNGANPLDYSAVFPDNG